MNRGNVLDNDNSREQQEANSYFDSPRKFENAYFSLHGQNNDKHFGAKQNEMTKYRKFVIFTDVNDKGQKQMIKWAFSHILDST